MKLDLSKSCWPKFKFGEAATHFKLAIFKRKHSEARLYTDGLVNSMTRYSQKTHTVFPVGAVTQHLLGQFCFCLVLPPPPPFETASHSETPADLNLAMQARLSQTHRDMPDSAS